jgi:signal transduction histidine kinase
LISSSPGTDALWLESFQRVCGKTAHELKGVLNGVSVNLEVVRSRSTKPDVAASAVASFAASASSQFDAVMDMTDALLALSRAEQGPVDLASTVKWLVHLLAPAAKADGRELGIDGSLAGLGTTSADGSAVRLAVAATLLASLDSCNRIVCRASGADLQVVNDGGGPAPTPGDDVVAAVRDAGITIQADPPAVSIIFPR